MIEHTQELFNYAISLIKVYSPWDKEYFPNPEEYSKEEFYVERTNALFVYTMTFILCHEYAHVEKEHLRQREEGNDSLKARIEFEEEADARAVELMLNGATEKTYKTICGGILIGLCSMLFFRKEIVSTDHPDTDNRIDDFMKRINPESTDPLCVWRC